MTIVNNLYFTFNDDDSRQLSAAIQLSFSCIQIKYEEANTLSFTNTCSVSNDVTHKKEEICLDEDIMSNYWDTIRLGNPLRTIINEL